MKKRILFVLLTFVMLLCMTPFAVTATGSETAGVASINGTTYETFAEALNVANALTGDVTVEVSGSVEFVNGMELKGNYSSIKFVGTTDTATITINQSAGGDYLEAHGKTVAFEDLTLAKANPAWSGNSGHMGNYFSIQGGTATYTNCTFTNGACTSGGTATYNSCTFKNDSEYGIWVYDDALVTVNGGTIDSKKGIKVYSEGETSVTSTLTVQNATFTENVTAKPAVAIGYAESVTLIGNTYNNTTPVLELDSGSDADCEGITFVAQDAEGKDISATIEVVDRSNGNAACGVLVNGKIYTTVAEAAKDVEKGDTVILLHASTETVELPYGVTLEKNGYEADNVDVEPISGSGTAEDPYLISNLDELIWFRNKVDEQAADGSTQFAGKYFKLTADIDLAGINWNPIGSMSGDHGSFKGVFDGNGHTISNLYVEQAGNGLGLFARIANGAVIENILLENVTIKSTDNSNYLGGLVGNAFVATINNVHVSGDVYISGRGYIGGIAGHGYVAMDDVSVNANEGSIITSTFWCAGGILGYGGEGSTNIKNAHVEGITITSAAGGLGAIVGMAESNGGKQPISGSNLSAANVEIKTYIGAYGDAYANYALGYLYGGNPSNLTGTNEIADIVVETSTGETPTLVDIVAKVGNKNYFSLQDAFNAVAEGETVVLLRDVTVTEAAYGQNALNITRAVNFTLDLNGYTLSADTGNSVIRFNIAESGATSDVTLTIKNGKIVSGANTWCTVMASGIEDAKAIMNLEDLVIENNKGGDFAVKAWANGLINAKNVTVNSTYGGGFYALGGEIVLDDCVVNQKGLWTAPYLSMAFGVSNGGKMTVNSGKYTVAPLAAADGNNQGTSHGSWMGGIMSSGGTLIINGGTFSNANIGGTASYPRELLFTGADADYGDDVAAYLEINGGTFSSIGDLVHCETIWGSETDSNNTYMPTMDIVITGGDFTGVAGKVIGGCDPISTGNPVGIEIVGGTYAVEVPEAYCGAGYISAETGNGSYYIKAQVEAKIGRKSFATLAAAIAAAKDGDKIILQADVVISEKLTIDKDITIADYGTYKISFVGNGGFSIVGNAEVTFSEFIIDISNAVAKGDCIIGVGNYSNNGKLTLDNMSVVGNGYSSAYAVFYVYNTSELNIKNSTINLSNDKASAGGFIKAEQGKDGIVNITDTEINLTDAKIGFLDGTVKFDGVDLDITGGANAINQSALTVIDSTLTITGCDGRALTLSQGDITIVNSKLDFSDCSEGEIRFKKGLTLNVDADSTLGDCTIYVDDVAVDVANVNGSAINGSEKEMANVSVSGGEVTVVNPEWVAKVDNGTTYKYYITLAEAFNAAGNITLLRDIELSESVTVAKGTEVVFDLNGKTITGTDTTSKNFGLINNNGTLTINDSVGGGKITLTATTNNGWGRYSAVISNNPGGTLVVNAGTLEHLGGTDMAYAIDSLTNGTIGAVKVTINGGTIKSTYRGIRQFANSATTLNELVINGGVIEGGNKAVWLHGPNTHANSAALTIGGEAVVGDVYVYAPEGGNASEFTIDVDADNVTKVVDGLPAGYEIPLIDGTYAVKSGVAKIGNVYYATLAEALAAVGAGDVVIDLVADATLDYGAREAYGTAETTSLTINGNGYTLTLNQKDSDWASIGLKNADAKLILNDIVIEKVGYGDTNGAWNTHAIIFTCNVEMNDATVNQSMSVQNGATLNNVTINEADGYYGLWIEGNGQKVTVTGGEINATNGGRGIKIADQYVDPPVSVELAVTGMVFNTAKKAAILVSSTAGAEITATDVNIENVAEDSENIAWVDEDWAADFGEVTVNGTPAGQESAESFVISVIDANGNVLGYYKTLDAAIAGANDGEIVVILTEEVEIPTIIPTGKDIEIVHENISILWAAKISGENGNTFYADFADALAAMKAGDTVVLYDNVATSLLCVPADVTLDLNGKTLTVDVAALAYGSIIDTAEVAGGLVIGSDKIVHLQPDNAGYMPLYDAEAGCYRFFEYTIDLAARESGNAMKFGLAINFANAEAYNLLATSTRKASVKFYFTWDNRASDPQVLTVSEELLAAYGKALAANPASRTRITVTVNGLDAISGQTLSTTVVMHSETVVETEFKIETKID